MFIKSRWLPIATLWLLPAVAAAESAAPDVNAGDAISAAVPYSMRELGGRCMADFADEYLCQRATKEADANSQYVVAVQYYDSGYMELAHAWGFFAASRGSVPAQKLMGEIYARGYGVPVDLVKSYEWYRTAAKSGDEEALYRLGIMNMEGIGTEKDPQKGVQYLIDAAGGGYGMAAYKLGLAFEDGVGVPSNITRAIGYYTDAANANIPEAQYRLGGFYETGRVLTRDNKQAEILYRHAAELGHPEAQFALATLLRTEGGNMPEVVKWYRASAEAGNVGAQEQLGLILLRGDAGTPDYTGAYKWLMEASLSNSAIADYGLGRIFVEGRGVPVNKARAEKHFLRAAELGSVSASYELGELYASNDNPKAALKYYLRAAGLGSEKARRQAGLMYMQGQGTAKDLVSAQKWLELAITSGSALAKFDLSRLYLTQGEEEKAVRLLREAADAGVPEAQVALAERYAKGEGIEQSAVQAYAWSMNAKECLPRIAYESSVYAAMLSSDEHKDAIERFHELQKTTPCVLTRD